MIRDDFIGVFDNALSPTDCNEIIDYFNKLEKLNLVYKREDKAHEKSDNAVYLFEPETLALPGSHPVLNKVLQCMWSCYDQYREKFSILTLDNKQGVLGMKIQRTQPGGGFHQWHYENQGLLSSERFAVFQMYLNTVEHGGETEFLYQKIRINPQQGRMVIWPAAYTHTHRGNPPLSGEKYIVTGWIEFLN
jgi:hypothetical protein